MADAPKLVLWQSETEELYRDGDVYGVRQLGDSWLVPLNADRTTEVLFAGPSAEELSARWMAFLDEVCEHDNDDEDYTDEGLSPSCDGEKLIEMFVRREKAAVPTG